MTNPEIEQRLWEYIDGFCTAGERTKVEALIQEDKKWRNTYEELLQVHRVLGSTELEQPSLRFTKNVMEAVAKLHLAPAPKAYINKNVIWGIAAFFVLSIVGFLIVGLGQIDWASAAPTSNPIGVDLTKVPYDKLFSGTVMHVFMMLNAVLGLMLLDRHISSKRKKIFESA